MYKDRNPEKACSPYYLESDNMIYGHFETLVEKELT